MGGFSRAYALHALIAEPGTLPGGRVFGWIANAVWPIPVALLCRSCSSCSPMAISRRRDGGRWPGSPAPRSLLIVFTTTIFATAIWTRPFTLANSARGGWLTSFALTLFVIVVFAIPVATFLSFASLAVRFSRSVGHERVQLKWFVTAALLVAVTFTVTLLTNSSLGSVLFDVSLLLLYAAIGTAILKHRLYDIDFFVNKAVVYGLLAAFITIVYVAIVVVVGAFVGATQFLSLVATAFVAIAFQPARERAKRAANRRDLRQARHTV